MTESQSSGTQEAPARGVIRIVHTRADGTLLEGSRRGDGVWEVVRPWFRSSRNVGIYIRNSRNKRADRWTINRAAEALRAAGFVVEIDIDDVTAGQTFAEAEAKRNDRAEDRAERYGERAARNIASGDARREAVRERMSHVPLGQPILVGHHSERRHRRLLDWAHTQEGKAVEERDKGRYWAGREQAAARYRDHREDVGTTRRRLDKLAAGERRLIGEIEGPLREYYEGQDLPDRAEIVSTEEDGTRVARLRPSAERRAVLEADLEYLRGEILYWQEVLAQAAERGVKLWSREDFSRGDFVIFHGVAVEVLRVNPKSLTIPWSHLWITAGPVATAEMCKGISHERMDTDTLPYDKVQGKILASELEGLTVGQARELITARRREARGIPAEA
ncbi:DUF3560 domain-containing protein [Nonomuraea sp. NPDC050790]|uniref:DUF3560 domain-containing protein n=1 Tax=Nonomuraea sp. NPDC050790 TaxID=3364371 RepID=UPI0037ADBF70